MAALSELSGLHSLKTGKKGSSLSYPLATVLTFRRLLEKHELGEWIY